MNFLDENGAVKPVFKLAELGAGFKDAYVRGHVNTIKGILSRPIEGHNIVTTGNDVEGVQFYGWGSPVSPHVDGTGFIFLMPIDMDSEDWLIAGNERIKLELGSIYGLNDTVQHSTEGNGRVVAVFTGSVTEDRIKTDRLYLQSVIDSFKRACFA